MGVCQVERSAETPAPPCRVNSCRCNVCSHLSQRAEAPGAQSAARAENRECVDRWLTTTDNGLSTATGQLYDILPVPHVQREASTRCVTSRRYSADTRSCSLTLKQSKWGSALQPCASACRRGRIPGAGSLRRQAEGESEHVNWKRALVARRSDGRTNVSEAASLLLYSHARGGS